MMARTFHDLHTNSPRDKGKNFQNNRAKDENYFQPGKGNLKAGKNTRVDGLSITPKLLPDVSPKRGGTAAVTHSP